jgi:hypothetical protein
VAGVVWVYCKPLRLRAAHQPSQSGGACPGHHLSGGRRERLRPPLTVVRWLRHPRRRPHPARRFLNYLATSIANGLRVDRPLVTSERRVKVSQRPVLAGPPRGAARLGCADWPRYALTRRRRKARWVPPMTRTTKHRNSSPLGGFSRRPGPRVNPLTRGLLGEGYSAERRAILVPRIRLIGSKSSMTWRPAPAGHHLPQIVDDGQTGATIRKNPLGASMGQFLSHLSASARVC